MIGTPKPICRLEIRLQSLKNLGKQLNLFFSWSTIALREILFSKHFLFLGIFTIKSKLWPVLYFSTFGCLLFELILAAVFNYFYVMPHKISIMECIKKNRKGKTFPYSLVQKSLYLPSPPLPPHLTTPNWVWMFLV